jgi:hypothetical protein
MVYVRKQYINDIVILCLQFVLQVQILKEGNLQSHTYYTIEEITSGIREVTRETARKRQ